MYKPEDHAEQREASLASARIVVPLLLEAFPASSVVDVGCGLGTWLKAFAECGVKDYLGYDGTYVAPETLVIPHDHFRAVDLVQGLTIGRPFEIACSVEVAEHLPSESGRHLVETLAETAPVVLFSAGIPGQTGPGHVNEQWQDYWAGLFARHGLQPADILRPQIWGDERVCWWYQQNIVVYCRPDLYPVGHRLPRSLNLVHPALYERDVGIRTALGETFGAVGRCFGRFLTNITARVEGTK